MWMKNIFVKQQRKKKQCVDQKKTVLQGRGGSEGEEVDDAKHPNQLSLAHLLDIWA